MIVQNDRNNYFYSNRKSVLFDESNNGKNKVDIENFVFKTFTSWYTFIFVFCRVFTKYITLFMSNDNNLINLTYTLLMNTLSLLLSEDTFLCSEMRTEFTVGYLLIQYKLG